MSFVAVEMHRKNILWAQLNFNAASDSFTWETSAYTVDRSRSKIWSEGETDFHELCGYGILAAFRYLPTIALCPTVKTAEAKRAAAT
jgi:hypothetical protein